MDRRDGREPQDLCGEGAKIFIDQILPQEFAIYGWATFTKQRLNPMSLPEQRDRRRQIQPSFLTDRNDLDGSLATDRLQT
jgi:hypothetical protein